MLRQGSSPSTTPVPPSEKPPLSADRGASQDGSAALVPAVSCLGKAKVHADVPDLGGSRPCGGFYMRHTVTGQILPARCNSHLCPACSPLHQMTARRAVEWGLLDRFGKGEKNVVFLTLTDTARGDLDLPLLGRRWNATRVRLGRMWGAGQYACSVEFQERGALHPHVCIEVAPEVAVDLVDRSTRESYRRRMHELRPAMESLGWGQMVDAKTVALQDASKVARYSAKSLAGYATKEAAERFKRAGAKHVRPLRLSYGWYPGGLAAARAHVLAQKPMLDGKIHGAWERIPKPRTC